MPPTRSHQGFTLLELMAAITIAALIMGVSAPAMQRMYQSMQYRGAVSDVVGTLNAARYTAIRQGQPQDVLINPETREVTIGTDVETLPSSLSLEVLGSAELNRDGAGVIRFFPDGGSSGGYINVSHSNGQQSVQVQIDWLLGSVTLCKSECDSPLEL